MEIKVKMFGLYAQAAGEAEFVIEIPDGSTVGHLVECLARRFPGLGTLVYEPGTATVSGKWLSVAVNGSTGHLEDRLTAGDTVAMFLPSAGG